MHGALLLPTTERAPFMRSTLPSGRNPWLTRGRLKNIGFRDGSPKVDKTKVAPDPITVEGDATVLTVRSLPSLIQAVGYLKYSAGGATYFRGQARLFDSMLPSLLRGASAPAERGKAIDRFVARSSPWACRHPNHPTTDCPEILGQAARSETRMFSGGVPRYAAEPLLQHYGLNTRWLDLVDNLWVALWFACHWFDGVDGYHHPVRRTTHDGGDDYVYVVSVSLPGDQKQVAPGLVKVPGRGRLIDLRQAVPSYYLRPHAQHGLLVRAYDDDYRNLELAAIRIPLNNALDWLGSSLLLSPFGLFPPPSVDVGYRRLLQAAALVPTATVLGQIDVYGAGY